MTIRDSLRYCAVRNYVQNSEFTVVRTNETGQFSLNALEVCRVFGQVVPWHASPSAFLLVYALCDQLYITISIGECRGCQM